MVGRRVLFTVVLAIVFVVTSLFTIISVNKMILPEKIKADADEVGQPKTEGGKVIIDIVNPDYGQGGGG